MEYILKKEIKTNRAVIRIYSPNISEEQKSTNMKLIHDAATQLLKERYRNEKTALLG